ncbi:DUF3579 domain-containing protein [Burkholderia diffusa]|uniref:DUF3579 domain-containing protein n=1 Tax=Burkholderia diffusa TaxID=488732 RepID=UPI000752EACB|nr:DUF3579 domain-containing protein [Burkholderia diffusa]KVC48830.1 hypothetical protein WI71_09550 [Burkholderia diffusa]KVG35297.1 hypothetical protein WJ30_06050 [Burkholderia diffusa]
MDRINITDGCRIDGFIVRGITHARKTFRPSDWPERLAGVITLFVGEKQPNCRSALTRLATPLVVDGAKCLLVSRELQVVCPDAFEFAMQFARDNDLPVDARRY